MAKVPFSKLNLKKIDKVQVVTINGLEVEVKQYLPVAEKLELIANVLNNSADDNNFANPVKTYVLSHLEIIYAYTNIKFTDKQLEDEGKLFDLMEENELINLIFSAIPEDETDFIMDSCETAAEAIYTYNNSAVGILENIKNNADRLGIDMNTIKQEVEDPAVMQYVKNLIETEYK